MDKVVEKAVEKVVDKRRALGRGLDTLLPGGPRPAGLTPGAIPGGGPGTPAEGRRGEEVLQLRLDQLSPNPYQTRSSVDENYLSQLAASISAHGVMQPVTVRIAPGGKYLLIAGECRWRASKLAEKETIPAIVKTVSDQQALELTIIENLQRQDLNCMDQAQAFQRLSDEFRMTQEEIALRTGLTRSTVSNYLRLVRLPLQMREMLRLGTLSFGHAKALMGLTSEATMVHMAEHASEDKMTVRSVEEYVFRVNSPDRGALKPEDKRYVDPNVRQAEVDLERALGIKVKIRDTKGKGSILLQYRNLEDFDRVVEMLKGQ